MKPGSSRGMDTRRQHKSEQSKRRRNLRLTNRSTSLILGRLNKRSRMSQNRAAVQAILAGMARPRIVDRDIGAAKAGFQYSFILGAERLEFWPSATHHAASKSPRPLAFARTGAAAARTAGAASRIHSAPHVQETEVKQQPYLELFDGDGPAPQGDHQPGERARRSPRVSAGRAGRASWLRTQRKVCYFCTSVWRGGSRLGCPHRAKLKQTDAPRTHLLEFATSITVGPTPTWLLRVNPTSSGRGS